MALWKPREEAVPRGGRRQTYDKSRERRTRTSLVTVMGSFIRVCRGASRVENVDWGRFQRKREGRKIWTSPLFLWGSFYHGRWANTSQEI